MQCIPKILRLSYSLHQSALVGDQNGIQFLGLYQFVLEELNYNIPTYISSLDNLKQNFRKARRLTPCPIMWILCSKADGRELVKTSMWR